MEKRNVMYKKLREFDELYFKGMAIVSDTEYDNFKSEFKKLFPDDPYLKEVVGFPINNKSEEIQLPCVVGGLDKVDINTVLTWANKFKSSIISSEKLDGNSIICTWKKGKLVFAATRGDGIVGQNILHKARFFVPSIPQLNETVTLRGEVLLEGEIYKELDFKNRRNGVSGLLRRDDIIPSHLSKLSVIFYELIEPELDISEYERLLCINLLNLKVPKYSIIYEINESLPKTLSELLVNYKENSNYDIDGLVLTVNDSKRENVMFPKSKVKFKVNEDAIKCEVINIEWNVTRLGMIKPVVIILPTDIMGATVSRCSGFNLDFIISGRIGIGSIVGVVRSGDVIPYITEVFKEKDPIIPTHCPSCLGPLKRISKELICDNDKCKQKQIYNVSHFFIEMGTDNITDRTIEMLGIYSIEEAYDLKIEDIQKLPGIGKKKAEIICEEIRKTLLIRPERLLSAFGMAMIGTTISKSLCSKFLFDELFKIKDPEVLGLGPITSRFFIDNIEKFKPLYEFLKSKGLQFEKENLEMKTLKGIKFALTGVGSLKRKEYISMVEEKGGEIREISKDTKYLVTDDPSSGSAKNKAAQKFGTKIITYSEFMDMLK